MEAKRLNTKTNQLQRIKKISVLMDSQFRGPLGMTFGLDGILGLIPFVGDFVTTLISLYIIYQAAMMGCSPATLLRMGLNLLIDSFLDAIPLLGNIFDFIWKANNKNFSILEEHLVHARTVTIKSRLTLGLVAFSLITVLIGSLAFTFYFLKMILDWISLFTS
jgi:hypothetical protein